MLPLHKDILGAELAGILGMLLLPAWTTCADDDSAVGISLAQPGARLLESTHFMTFMMQRSLRRNLTTIKDQTACGLLLRCLSFSLAATF